MTTRDSVTHHLNVAPEYFDALIEGRKTFEIRLNDRDFQVGDVLVLKKHSESGVFSPPFFRRTVSYVLTDEFAGLTMGYVCMGLTP